MSDLALTINDEGDFDLSISGRDLSVTQTLENAILISLFTDARADDDDILPNNNADRGGWWGDAFATQINGTARPIGSKLWLLSRSKITNETIAKVRDYSRLALQWLIDDGMAQNIEVSATRVGAQQISILAIITKPNGEIFKYEKLWGN